MHKPFCMFCHHEVYLSWPWIQAQRLLNFFMVNWTEHEISTAHQNKCWKCRHSKAVLILWIICAIHVLCLSWFRVCSLLFWVHLLGKGWPLCSCLWCLIVFLSLFQVVSWAKCGTWLYRFLIFAAFLTFYSFKTLGFCVYHANKC